MESRLVDRRPQVSDDRLLADLVPPPQFQGVAFATYRPDPAQPTQAAAVAALQAFADHVAAGRAGSNGRSRRWFGRAPVEPERRPGIYLDGGFGVGKTHLLSSLWHATSVPPAEKLFCTFVEMTNLVGALGFGPTVQRLSNYRLVCIDEFELDDPGDTVLMSTLLSRLSDAGVWLAATSNTLPGKLGDGRFAADDFLREIQALAARFDVIRIDGDDYRHRGLPSAPDPIADDVLADATFPAGATVDVFDDLLDHLATLHPSRYGPLLDGIDRVVVRRVRPVDDQNVALRLVVLADRLYDRGISVVTSGVALDRLFTDDLLSGGYRKKYYRAVSRLTALARDAAYQVPG